MIPARSTQERKRIFAEVWRFLEGPRARQTDGYNSIMALMRAAGVDHACGKNDKNDEEGDEEGDEGEKEGYDDDRDAVVQPGTLEYKSWRKRRGRRHPRHWVVRLLLMLRADPKIPGGWTLFRESILEFLLSMHPSRLSGSSN